RAAAERLGAQRHGHVERPPDFDAEEARRRDADDVVAVAVEDDAAADRRVAAVLALPEAIADDRGRRRATRVIVSRRDDAAGECGNLERLEEVAAHTQSLRVAYLAARRQVERDGSPR